MGNATTVARPSVAAKVQEGNDPTCDALDTVHEKSMTTLDWTKPTPRKVMSTAHKHQNVDSRRRSIGIRPLHAANLSISSKTSLENSFSLENSNDISFSLENNKNTSFSAGVVGALDSTDTILDTNIGFSEAPVGNNDDKIPSRTKKLESSCDFDTADSVGTPLTKSSTGLGRIDDAQTAANISSTNVDNSDPKVAKPNKIKLESMDTNVLTISRAGTEMHLESLDITPAPNTRTKFEKRDKSAGAKTKKINLKAWTQTFSPTVTKKSKKIIKTLRPAQK